MTIVKATDFRYNIHSHIFMAKDGDKEFEKYKDILAANAPEECEVCGGPLVLENVNLEDYEEGKLYMMEKVPAFVCQECGEIWVPEPIIQEFEKMIDTAKDRTNPDKIPPKKSGQPKSKTEGSKDENS